MNTKAISIISKDLKFEWIYFLQNFKNYDLFIVIDDNVMDYQTIYQEKYKNIHFIQIEPEECQQKNYKNTSTLTIHKEICGWDKALYYFTHVNKKYEHVWFIEDDVFFHGEQTLINLDKAYENTDIICNSNFEKAKLNEWMWSSIDIQLPYPYYCGMMCGIRVSKKMLEAISDYAEKNKTLFFLEALFPTIAEHYSLTHIQPEEIVSITYKNQWSMNDYNKTGLFHPVKQIEQHNHIRNFLDFSS